MFCMIMILFLSIRIRGILGHESKIKKDLKELKVIYTYINKMHFFFFRWLNQRNSKVNCA